MADTSVRSGSLRTPSNGRVSAQDTEQLPVIVGATERGEPVDDTTAQLKIALRNRDAGEVRRLLRRGARQSTHDRGTALLEAARTGNHEMLGTLLGAGYDPRCGNMTGWTALHEAARWPQVARVLLEQEDLDWDIADALQGVTPLHALVRHVTSVTSEPPLDVVREIIHRSDGNRRTRMGDTALHLAAGGRHDQLQVVRLLLAAGCNPEAPNGREETPLHVALLHDHRGTAKLLLEAGANIGAPDRMLQTPLHLAAARDSQDIIRMALEQDDQHLNARDANGETALHAAARRGHNMCVRLLLDAGADATIADARGKSPLEAATIGGFVETVRTLLEVPQPDLVRRAATSSFDRTMSLRRKTAIGDLLQAAMDTCQKTDPSTENRVAVPR